jgi:hypothetical protein
MRCCCSSVPYQRYKPIQCPHCHRRSARFRVLLFIKLEQCDSEQRSISTCSCIAAGSQCRDIRWRLWYVLSGFFLCFCRAHWPFKIVFFDVGVRDGSIAHALCLTLFAATTAGNPPSDAVDIFNTYLSSWSTSNLCQPRGDLSAASLPNFGLAIFAGGSSTSLDLL